MTEAIRTGAFRGSFVHQLDAKGRVSLPAVFRQTLLREGAEGVSPTCVLTNFITDGARCLEGYTLSGWQAFEAKLASRSRFDPQIRKLENFYLARAVECPVDSNGRINIPQHLRDYAGLERDVVFAGSLHGFRVWDKRVWDMIFNEAEAALLENPGLFADVDI